MRETKSHGERFVSTTDEGGKNKATQTVGLAFNLDRCKKSVRFYFSITLATLCVNCTSIVTVATPQLEIPATYSDIPVKIKRHFERSETTTYSGWGSANPSADNKYLEEILKQEIAQTPGAKGIKNLRVRYYNPWQSTFQFFNIFGYVIGVGARSGIMYGLIYRTKELEVSGDIY